jgi:hypothetical protein
MRRILVGSALFVALAAVLPRLAKISDIDTAISAQLAFAALLFATAWFAHWIKERRRDGA